MALVEIANVTVLPDSNGCLKEFEISSPDAGTSRDIYAITVEGCVVPTEGPPKALVVGAPGERGPRWRLPLNVPRPDVASRHEDLLWSRRCGFRDLISVTQLPKDFDLHVVVQLPNEQLLNVAAITGHRHSLPPGPDSRFQPVMVTSLGRTGGTWAMLLLDQHPEITGFRPFDYEPRVGSYWSDVFHVLAEPRSYQQFLYSEMRGMHWWMGRNLAPPPQQTLDPTVEEWLGSGYIDELIGVIKGRIDAFYGKVAESLAKPTIKYFAEKCGPGATVQPLFWEIYPEAREIFLVRDFRDMAASMLAYGKKRGYQFFGREKFSSDEDYLHGLRLDAQLLLDQWNERSSSGCLLKYEDLMRDPVEALSSVLSYIGVDSDNRVVEKMIHDASQANVR